MLDCFDRIHVINLPERTDRRRQIAAQLASIGLYLDAPGVERFEAVRPRDAGGFRTVGAHGCFLSHLGALSRSVQAGHRRILILEDDTDFMRDFGRRWPRVSRALRESDWQMFYGGHLGGAPATAPGGAPLVAVDPSQELGGSHFVAFDGDTIAQAAGFLRTLLARPAGDPRGGPMDVDGAYSWLRRQHGLTTLAAAPVLCRQRASRTDVSAPGRLDRLPMVRDLVGLGRHARNALARRVRGGSRGG